MAFPQYYSTNMVKRIGIMGGTFDPPHIGHLAMAEQVLEAMALDMIWFIPTGKISYKDSSQTASTQDRLEMTQLSTIDNPRFSVNTIETEMEGNSYTYKTLEILKERFPDYNFVFIVGADSLNYMEKWREPEKIFDKCQVAAVNRMGISKEQFLEKREFLKERFNADITLIEMPILDISSTELRKRIKQGKSIRYLVKDSVREYIAKNGLYADAKGEDTYDRN